MHSQNNFKINSYRKCIPRINNFKIKSFAAPFWNLECIFLGWIAPKVERVQLWHRPDPSGKIQIYFLLPRAPRQPRNIEFHNFSFSPSPNYRSESRHTILVNFLRKSFGFILWGFRLFWVYFGQVSVYFGFILGLLWQNFRFSLEVNQDGVAWFRTIVWRRRKREIMKIDVSRLSGEVLWATEYRLIFSWRIWPVPDLEHALLLALGWTHYSTQKIHSKFQRGRETFYFEACTCDNLFWECIFYKNLFWACTCDHLFWECIFYENLFWACTCDHLFWECTMRIYFGHVLATIYSGNALW